MSNNIVRCLFLYDPEFIKSLGAKYYVHRAPLLLLFVKTNIVVRKMLFLIHNCNNSDGDLIAIY